MTRSWWLPTRKWAVARVTAVAALATMWATTGSWDLEETITAIGLVTAAALSWLTPNADEPEVPAVLEGRGRR